MPILWEMKVKQFECWALRSRYIVSSVLKFVFISSHSDFSPLLLLLLLLFFFLRKISPELTSAASRPLFAEEDWPWANICAHLPLLYMWDAYHIMAYQAMPCLHPGSALVNSWPLSPLLDASCCFINMQWCFPWDSS